MEQSQISSSLVGDRLPPLSGKHVWLVAQILEAEDTPGEQVFYSMHDPMTHYRCRVPELLRRRIRGCFHGWVIMSNHPHNVMWSLWNPSASKFIRLPPLKHEEVNSIVECCLPSSPDNIGSILLLIREEKPTFVFCRLDRKERKLRWTEMSYAKQLKNIIEEDGFIYSLTCCNGKVYALNTSRGSKEFVIEVDIVVNDKEVIIRLLPFVNLPTNYNFTRVPGNCYVGPILIGSCSELFVIYLHFTWPHVCNCVHLVKLDKTDMLWEEMEDLDGVVCFVDGDSNSPAIASELGGYIYYLSDDNKAIYSYNVKDKTMTVLSSMPAHLELPLPSSKEPPTSYVSVWAMPECKFECDHGEINQRVVSKQEHKEGDGTFCSMMNQQYESRLFDIPFHVLEMIMEHCFDADYVNFRATCTQLTAPVTRRSNKASIRRLQRYSLISPWLMVLDKDQGIITFTDPMFGDKYSIGTPPELKGNVQIHSSMYGWLLMSSDSGSMMLFNPFTSDIRKLPRLEVKFLETFCFSAPPSSSDCMVVGFGRVVVCIHFVARQPATWLSFHLNFSGDARIFAHSISCGANLYALDFDGRLSIFINFWEEDYTWDDLDVAPTSSCRSSMVRYYLVKHDGDVLLVMMGEFGESVELFKLNSSSEKWDKIDGLGKDMIYICDTTCLCLEARTPEMENKIFFARLHSKKGKIVFYSLETCRYHTFSGRNIVESSPDLFGTRHHLDPHVWIEPSYS